MLGNRKIDKTGIDVVDDRRRRVEGDDADLARLTRLLYAVRSAESGEQIGTKNAIEVRIAGVDCLQLGRRLVGVIVVVLCFQNGDVRILLHLVLETLLTLVSRRDAGLHV